MQTLEELDAFITTEQAKIDKCNALIKEYENTPSYRFIKRHTLRKKALNITKTYRW